MLNPVDPNAPSMNATGAGVLPLKARAVSMARDGRTLLDRIDVSISAAPAITVLLGPNGAGKSLLVRVLAGLLTPDEGQLTWAGTPPDRRRAAKIGLVFQKPALLNRSARANIDYALKVTGTPPEQRIDRSESALHQAGLTHLAEQSARSLSGGEQQRLALARTIACQPGIFILDEPTANLDPASTASIERLLMSIRKAGTPVFFITHDLAQARRLADAVIFMHRGCILERTDAKAFFSAPQTQAAGRFIAGELLI